LLRQEGDQWAALAVELNLASCRPTVDQTREALKDAVKTYVRYMIDNDRVREIGRCALPEDVRDFLEEPPGEHHVERAVLVVGLQRRAGRAGPRAARIEFIPSTAPVAYDSREPAAR